MKTMKIAELQRSLDEKDRAMEAEVGILLERARKQEDEIKRLLAENHEIAISNAFNKAQLDEANVVSTLPHKAASEVGFWRKFEEHNRSMEDLNNNLLYGD